MNKVQQQVEFLFLKCHRHTFQRSALRKLLWMRMNKKTMIVSPFDEFIRCSCDYDSICKMSPAYKLRKEYSIFFPPLINETDFNLNVCRCLPLLRAVSKNIRWMPEWHQSEISPMKYEAPPRCFAGWLIGGYRGGPHCMKCWQQSHGQISVNSEGIFFSPLTSLELTAGSEKRLHKSCDEWARRDGLEKC